MTFVQPNDIRKKKMIEDIRDNATGVNPNVKQLLRFLVFDLIEWSDEGLAEILATPALAHLKDERLP